MDTHQLRVNIDIGYDDFLPYYDGRVKVVVASDMHGRKVHFPASALQPYLTHTGVKGIFELRIDGDNKLVSCERFDDIR